MSIFSVKTRISGMLILLSFYAAMGQEKKPDKELPAKRIAVDVFYGGPNLISLLVKAAELENSTSTRYSIGPVGIRGEYFITKEVSVGAEVHYARSGYQRTLSQNLSYRGVGRTFVFRDELIIERTRFYPRMAYHFGKDNYQVYGFAALGVALWKASYKIQENTLDYFTDIPPLEAKTYPGLAFRIGFGGRYFFTKNIGINADIGLGGPLFTGGISARF